MGEILLNEVAALFTSDKLFTTERYVLLRLGISALTRDLNVGADAPPDDGPA
jgi:hypothetical protein